MATGRSAGRKTSTKKTCPVEQYLCPYCNTIKKAGDFYMSSDPLVMTGRTVMCKDCAEKIARNYSARTKTYGDCTKASVQEALERLDKPFLENIWNSSYFEYINDKSGKQRNNIWSAYIKNISMPQYKAMRWRDGDLFEAYKTRALNETNNSQGAGNDATQYKEVDDGYEINRRDVIRMVGYDPFANYPVKEDKPVLYAQLVSFIDDETKNDGMKMNAVIQIVQAFNQIQKINDAINDLTSDIRKLNNNNGTIKQLADTTSKLLSGANALAKDNGISVNFNNNKSKGANTMTGKMRELELIGFRNEKINTYDIDYCNGMRQVAEISAKAQIDQIGFDENVINEINGIRRELVESLQKERDKAVERARVLLVENKDLKDFMREKGLLDENGCVIDG